MHAKAAPSRRGAAFFQACYQQGLGPILQIPAASARKVKSQEYMQL